MKKMTMCLRFYLRAIFFYLLSMPLVIGHTYFFGMTELSNNVKTQHIEIIHELTAHDVEYVIAQQKNISFSSEHPHYEEYIKNYIEQHFQIFQKNKPIVLQWVGLRFSHGKMIIYQESIQPIHTYLFKIKHSILMDYNAKQVNTLNYRLPKKTGSLTFLIKHLYRQI
jgi:hypothetical protein